VSRFEPPVSLRLDLGEEGGRSPSAAAAGQGADTLTGRAQQTSVTQSFLQGASGDEDEALVAALRRGTPGAFEALFQRHGGHVHRVLLRTLGPDPELPDLVHDVFLAVLDDIDGLRDASKLKSWMASIAVFMARGCIRRRQRWRWFSRQPVDEPTSTPTPVGPEVSEAVRSTTAILAQLPVDERIAFSLRFIDGMKLEEVAEACRTSLATIKRRISRGEKRFLALANEHPALREWLSRGTRWSDTSEG
jgi:RNA polymerase sigma-70 factor (ECF subfamily)